MNENKPAQNLARMIVCGWVKICAPEHLRVHVAVCTSSVCLSNYGKIVRITLRHLISLTAEMILTDICWCADHTSVNLAKFCASSCYYLLKLASKSNYQST